MSSLAVPSDVIESWGRMISSKIASSLMSKALSVCSPGRSRRRILAPHSLRARAAVSKEGRMASLSPSAKIISLLRKTTVIFDQFARVSAIWRSLEVHITCPAFAANLRSDSLENVSNIENVVRAAMPSSENKSSNQMSRDLREVRVRKKLCVIGFQ